MRYLLNENPYIWVRFTTGDSVTITIYKSSDSSVIVNAVNMNELVSTGYFSYQFNPSPSTLTEYFYIATNSIEEHAGKIILGGYPNDVKEGLTDIKGTGFIKDTHSLKPILDDVTGLNGSAMVGTDGVPTNPLLTNDIRIDNLDVAISSRANQNPPSQILNDYKANVSGLATEVNATQNKVDVIEEIDDNETKIDDIKIEIDNAVYGLQALKNIFDEIKGVGWTVENLKAIYDAIQNAGIKDWSDSEQKQIRNALGVDGDKIDALGGQLQEVLGISQKNYKWFDPVYDANHNLLSVTLKFYANSSDYNNEVNEILTSNVTGHYNSLNELIGFGRKKI